MEEGFGGCHFLTWCAVESLLQIVAVVIQLESAGVSIEGSRMVLSVTFDKMIIALMEDHQVPGAVAPLALAQQNLQLQSSKLDHHLQ
jgi:hypothetical protein